MATPTAPDLTHLPGTDGRPLVGHTFEYLRDPFGFAFRMHAAHGPLFRSRVFFERGVAVGTPDFAERFFVDKDELFSSRQGWWNVLGAFFPGGLMLRDFAEHRMHRRIMQVAFKPQALRGYVERIEPLVARAVDGLGARVGAGPTKMYPVIKQLLLDTAAAVFVGVDLAEETRALNRDFVAVMHAAGAAVRAAVPLTPYWRGLRARRRLSARFHALLAARTGAPEGQDMLSLLAHAVSEEGERFAADDIVEHVLFLLMAAHDTTTSGLTCMLMLLAQHPAQQERARAEVQGLTRVTADDVARLPFTWDCFRETLRLYPPVRSVPRRTTRACEVEGHAIPANTPMWVNTEVLHRDPSLWTRPDAFEPERFAEPREEHKRHKFAWVPFGAGAHTCLGLQFSRLEMSVFVHALLSRYRVSVPADYRPRMQYLPFVRPVDDLPLTFTPIA